MCGISAIIIKKGEIVKDQLTCMIDSLNHRGPDAQGIYLSGDLKVGLAHRRLSLVDLSPKGNQPITKHNRTIIFNGEIYNYKALLEELKNKGYSFSSHCDTEVILSSFQEWGIDCLKKFNGAFAFVLYEHETKDVFIVRDRIGEKPLYYTETSDSFLFASEIKAFFKIPGIQVSADIDTIKASLIFHFFADKGSTYFKNIFSLRPGSYIKIKDGKMNFYKYWDINISDQINYINEDANLKKDLHDIDYLINDAVNIRLDADTKVASLLSGGIDSCLITEIASRMTPYPISSFTLSKKEVIDKDFYYADQLVKKTPNLKHIKVDVNDQIFSIENIERITKHLEEVVLHKVSVYVNANYKAVKQNGFKTTLNGQGSDEISCGYYDYYKFLHADMSTFEYNNFSKFWYNQFDLREYTSKSEVKELIDNNLKVNYSPYLSKDILNSVLAFGIKTHLLNILNHEDRFSMAESVECRTVFTDYRIIEKFMSIPSKYKVHDGREKYLLRKVSEKYLPNAIVKRKKQGFPNFSTELEKKLVNRIISDKNFNNSLILNEIFNKKLFSDIHQMPLDLQWKLANIYVFEKAFLN